jgi:hypothetical protein
VGALELFKNSVITNSKECIRLIESELGFLHRVADSASVVHATSVHPVGIPNTLHLSTVGPEKLGL